MYGKKGRIENISAVREQFKSLLGQMRDCGVELYIDGRRALPEEAAAKSVCEDSPYMADYVFGDAGKIEEVHFDKVTGR
ncbi:MAG: hypothetical protein NC432_10585 [Roseburia sp.]|nr:hypothetical protein [Roseburia sp.]MCM1099178.1 hypothetical protein [Ruminococcus flavefaciens]